MILAFRDFLLVFVPILFSYEKGVGLEARTVSMRTQIGRKDAAGECTQTQEIGTIFEFLSFRHRLRKERQTVSSGSASLYPHAKWGVEYQNLRSV